MCYKEKKRKVFSTQQCKASGGEEKIVKALSRKSTLRLKKRITTWQTTQKNAT